MKGCEILLLEIMKFFIGQASSIDNYEMRHIFNMFDNLITNINYTVAQTQKPKRQCDLISSQPASPFTLRACFFEISPTRTSKYLSILFPVSPNFAVIQQYKTRLVHQTSFKYPFVFLVNTTSEKIYENYKKTTAKLN